MEIDFFSIGDTQLDTVMVLDPQEVDVRCKLNNVECTMNLDYAGKVPVRELHEMVAGNAANAAVTGARLNGGAGFWTMLGDDEIADRQIKFLKDQGVDTTFVKKTPNAQSNQSTVISVSGERTILVFHADRQYVLPANLPKAKWVYLTSMAKGSEDIFNDLAKYIDETGAKLAYQPGTYQLRMGADRAKEILNRTDFIVMNKQEAQLYGQNDDEEISHLLDALKALGPKIVVITDGKNGSYATDGTKKWYLGIRPEIPRIESTGAGDAFSSAFAVSLLEGKSIPEAMRRGTFNAEGVIQKFGPQAGILTKEQMEIEVQGNPDLQPKEI